MPLFRLVLSSVPLALMLFAAPVAYACDCGNAAAEAPTAEAKSGCDCADSCACDAVKTEGAACACDAVKTEGAACACNKGAEGKGACTCDNGDCGCATGACGCGH